MATYIGNAYEILSQVRYAISEFSTAYVQGTDTTGKFQNTELMKHINNAQSYIWSILFGQFPEYFMKSASLTFTSSVASLPSDCFKIKEISDPDGFPISPINLNQRHITTGGSEHQYYRYRNTIRIDEDGVSNTGTIWYYQKCRDLDTGLTSAGGALSATLATTAKSIADYYNDMMIENVTDSTVDTITDYATTRVCVVSNTWASSKYYGIVSDLPEIFHPLISEYAVLQLKKDPRVPLQVSPSDSSLFNEMLRESMGSFAGTQNSDVFINDVINAFEPIF